MDKEKEEEFRPNNSLQRYLADPTPLTTQQLWREIGALKELIMSRLEAMDTAIVVAHEDLVRVPTDVQKQVGNLKDLHDEKFSGIIQEFSNRDALYAEKFASIQVQFKERDTRAEQTTKDGKTAVDAALQAAKEAVGKSETATVKQIDQQAALIGTATRALDDKITDTKDRLTRLEGKGEGSKATNDHMYLVAGIVIAVLGLAVAFLRGGLN